MELPSANEPSSLQILKNYFISFHMSSNDDSRSDDFQIDLDDSEGAEEEFAFLDDASENFYVSNDIEWNSI
jgi:hypothetical protein